VTLRTALFLPPFGELCDARAVADLAAEAEARGFDGFFVWDHVRYREPHRLVADPWIVLAAVAVATERMRIGPMVTPVPRRRPHVLARQTVTLDHLSSGRLVFGAGLGSDGAGEFSGFGEEVDLRRRAALLDEGLERLTAYWAGEFEPPPVQQPRIPIWLAAVWPHQAPVLRAARYDGLFPIGCSADEFAELVALAREHRITAEPFEVAARGGPDEDPAPYEAAGATWWLVGIPPGATVADVRAVIADR
jgi:alkanesulfonate monooxygenase SsuD/methylene tetrahydromethanopterin reductase-like flavin-dependent oxidoreductase (luciferase family)